MTDTPEAPSAAFPGAGRSRLRRGATSRSPRAPRRERQPPRAPLPALAGAGRRRSRRSSPSCLTVVWDAGASSSPPSRCSRAARRSWSARSPASTSATSSCSTRRRSTRPRAAPARRPVRADRAASARRLRRRAMGRRTVARAVARRFASLLAGRVAGPPARRAARAPRALPGGRRRARYRTRPRASSTAPASTPTSSPASALDPTGAAHRRASAAAQLVTRPRHPPRDHRAGQHGRRATCSTSSAPPRAGVRVSLLPRLFDVVGTSVEFDDLDGLTLLGVRRFGLSRSSPPLKRALRPRRRRAAAARRRAAPGRDRDRDQARLARPGPLPPDARRPRRQALPDLQVPHDGPGRRGAQGRAAHRNEAEGLFKIADDPRITRVGALPAPHLARRAAAAVQRLARRDEPRRPAAARRRRGRAVAGCDRRRLHLTPGMTGPLADPRLGPGAAARDGQDRLPLRRELVALGRRQDPAADRAVHARPPRHVAFGSP